MAPKPRLLPTSTIPLISQDNAAVMTFLWFIWFALFFFWLLKMWELQHFVDPRKSPKSRRENSRET